VRDALADASQGTETAEASTTDDEKVAVAEAFEERLQRRTVVFGECFPQGAAHLGEIRATRGDDPES